MLCDVIGWIYWQGVYHIYSTNMMITPSKHRGAKADRFSLSQLLLVLIIGSAVSLLGFNYYHALQCPDNNPDATEASIEALSRRLMYSESLVKSNAATLARLLKDMEEDLTVLGKDTRDNLHQEAIREAVQLAIRLSDLPVPPKPWDFEDEHGIVYEKDDESEKHDDKDKDGWTDEYEAEKEAKEAEDDDESGDKEKKKYGKGVDDYLGSSGDDDKKRGDDPTNGNYQQKPDSWSDPETFGGVSSDKQATFTDGLSDAAPKPKRRQRGGSGSPGEGKSRGEEGGGGDVDEFDDPGEEGGGGKEDIFRDNLSDADARHICNDWKKEHNVVPGVSWGSLPFQLQQKWLQYACDFLLG